MSIEQDMEEQAQKIQEMQDEESKKEVVFDGRQNSGRSLVKGLQSYTPKPLFNWDCVNWNKYVGQKIKLDPEAVYSKDFEFKQKDGSTKKVRYLNFPTVVIEKVADEEGNMMELRAEERFPLSWVEDKNNPENGTYQWPEGGDLAKFLSLHGCKEPDELFSKAVEVLVLKRTFEGKKGEITKLGYQRD